MDIKLTYFDFNGGRGEDARLALHMAGVDFTDDRIDGRSQWPGLKPNTPWRNLPMLEVEGKGTIGQSNAVLGWIGREFGMHPSDSWEAARHEAVMSSVEELRHVVAGTGSKDPDEKRRLREAFAEGALKRWASCVESEIVGPFLSGDALQVADLKVFVMLSFLANGALDHVSFDSLSGFPKLNGLFDAVGSDPRVEAWYAAH